MPPPPSSGTPAPNLRTSHEGLCRATGGVLASPLSGEEAAGVAVAAAVDLLAASPVRLGLWRRDGTPSGGPADNLVAADGRAALGADGEARRSASGCASCRGQLLSTGAAAGLDGKQAPGHKAGRVLAGGVGAHARARVGLGVLRKGSRASLPWHLRSSECARLDRRRLRAVEQPGAGRRLVPCHGPRRRVRLGRGPGAVLAGRRLQRAHARRVRAAG
jgi:hypothetical protein